MKFKIDENFPAELIADLRAAGHEAETVPAQGFRVFERRRLAPRVARG